MTGPVRRHDPAAPARLDGATRRGQSPPARPHPLSTAGPDAVAVVGADGTIRAVSAAFARAAGSPVGESLLTLVHPDDHVGVVSALGRLGDEVASAGPVAVRMVSTSSAWVASTLTLTRVSGESDVHGAVLVGLRDAPRGAVAPSPVGAGRSHPLVEGLGEALGAGQLRLVYQPKVFLATNRIVGVEALLRWDHPVRGPVPPGEFVPAAEASGLIVPIGEWVLAEACRQGASWQRAFPRATPFGVAVNVSAQQLSAGLVRSVRDAVDASGIDAAGLCLEVTESAVMEDVEHAAAVLSELKKLGLTVSIDDFGTGYSSLEYLRRLPLDEVKIDQSFVAGLAVDPKDTAVVATVISLAHALDHDVVAEGVETSRQLDKLRAFGCELAQGFLLARPVSAAGVTELLAREAAGDLLVSGGPAAAAGAQTVVVADDAADVRQLARMSLTAAGFDVEEAPDGETTIELARRLRPACVVLDVSMPDRSGIEVCQLLRADSLTASCTIVMLTMSDEAADKAAAFSAGADDYIVKPFAPRDLVSRVRAALARHGSSAGRRYP